MHTTSLAFLNIYLGIYMYISIGPNFFFFCCRLCSALLCVDMSSSRYLPISLGQLGTWATCRHPKRGNSTSSTYIPCIASPHSLYPRLQSHPPTREKYQEMGGEGSVHFRK